MKYVAEALTDPEESESKLCHFWAFYNILCG